MDGTGFVSPLDALNTRDRGLFIVWCGGRTVGTGVKAGGLIALALDGMECAATYLTRQLRQGYVFRLVQDPGQTGYRRLKPLATSARCALLRFPKTTTPSCPASATRSMSLGKYS